LFSLDKRQFGKKQVLLSIMTTQAYYKDRLGFDPNDPKEMSSLDPTLHGYEENLTKFKGLLSVFWKIDVLRKNVSRVKCQRVTTQSFPGKTHVFILEIVSVFQHEMVWTTFSGEKLFYWNN
jgi:hypothetical protein